MPDACWTDTGSLDGTDGIQMSKRGPTPPASGRSGCLCNESSLKARDGIENVPGVRATTANGREIPAHVGIRGEFFRKLENVGAHLGDFPVQLRHPTQADGVFPPNRSGS
jgi:hypothetical protein